MAKAIRPPRQRGETELEQAHRVLEALWGYKDFRPHQADIVARLIAGQDVLALMPTGGGKSLCYQIPSIIREGTGIVVSPLIALMQDQVGSLEQIGVKAACLNSSLSWAEQKSVEDRFVSGALDLLYVAPERLVQDRMLAQLERARLALFAIDEAHCVSQWGHDFRPEYRQLSLLAKRFPNVPRIALTATADERTRTDIISELQLHSAERFVASFDRPNIRYTISESGSIGGRDRLWQFLETEHPTSSGIVYCLTRKGVEETAEWLRRKGRTALAYHAGLPAETRRSVLQRFLNEDAMVVVATIAFGMGIDKPDVRFVAHLNLPKTIESYYQETGRAGRDGEAADAWMAYGMNDIMLHRQWITASEGSDAFKTVQRQKLDALIGLAEMAGCRRQALLAYFGQGGAQPCGNCDNCLSPPQTVDGTEAARKALSAVYRTGQRFGVGYVIDVLLGKADERVVRNRHDTVTVFGIGKELQAEEWRSLFRQLVARGQLTGDDEGHGTLLLTEQARPLLRGEERFAMRRAISGRGKKVDRASSRADTHVRREDQALYEALKALRLRLASEAGMPPYVICHDRTLRELAEHRPGHASELAGITGLGERKIARYGARLLETIGRFKPHPLLDNRLSATVNETLTFVLQGDDLEDIAAKRGLDVSTIHGHLAEAIEAGLVEAQAVLQLDEAEIDEIHSAFDRCGTLESGKLGPVHAALGGKFDFGVLKCMLAELS